MAITVIRYSQPGTISGWGVAFGASVAPLAGLYPTTGDFLTKGGIEEAKALTSGAATLPINELHLESPISNRQQVILLGLNYPCHAIESGVSPRRVTFNTIFTKAPSSLCGAHDAIIRPRHVRLLDYEVELGLVLRSAPPPGLTVTPDMLPHFLAGLVIVNDISARDVQLPQGQFYKGKSYRTFGPTGPFLTLLEPEDWQHLPRLRMQLRVNGEIRQDASCGAMIFPPHRTLTELAGLQDLWPGDLIATGTPGGCAAKAPGKIGMFLFQHVLSETMRWKLFRHLQRNNPLFLRPGDLVQTSIRTEDGVLDLGQQCNVVADETHP